LAVSQDVKGTIMEKRLTEWKNKCALVTGASAGVGKATVHVLAQLGMKVAIAARRRERLEELAADLKNQAADVLVLSGDQIDPEFNRQMFAEIRQRWGGVDLLVNNAGKSGGKGVADADFDEAQSCLNLNVRAAFICMQEAVKDMRRHGFGTIINISSMTGHRTVPGRGSGVYGASKHALRAVTEGLRCELTAQKAGIKVSLISPGMIDTEWHRDRSNLEKRPDYDFEPLAPEDVAEAVLYILSTSPHANVCDVLLRPVEQVF
jgi:NADP-dependent 3-hydroxy acid dehydrogenase YdfG